MCEFELPDVSLRCFVARQLLLRIYALSSVKFSGLKLWLCKKCDKYEVWWWGISLYLCQIHGHCAWATSMGYEHGACYCPLSTSMSHVTIDPMHIWQTNIDMAEYGACLSHQIVCEDAPYCRDRHKNSTFYLICSREFVHKNSTFYLICRFPAPLWLLFLEGFSSVKLVSHGY